jgi:hypothetical protein
LKKHSLSVHFEIATTSSPTRPPLLRIPLDRHTRGAVNRAWGSPRHTPYCTVRYCNHKQKVRPCYCNHIAHKSMGPKLPDGVRQLPSRKGPNSEKGQAPLQKRTWIFDCLRQFGYSDSAALQPHVTRAEYTFLLAWHFRYFTNLGKSHQLGRGRLLSKSGIHPLCRN